MLIRFGVKPWELDQMEATFVDELIIKLKADHDEAVAQERRRRAKLG